MPSTTSSTLTLENFGLSNPERPGAWVDGFSPRLPVEADFQEKPRPAQFGEMKRAHREALKRREEETRRDIAEYKLAIRKREERLRNQRARGYIKAQTQSRVQVATNGFCGDKNREVGESEYGDTGEDTNDSELEDLDDSMVEDNDLKNDLKNEINGESKHARNGQVRAPKLEPEMAREVMNDISPTQLHNGTNTAKSDHSKATEETAKGPRKRGWIGWVLVSDEEDENGNVSKNRGRHSEQDLGRGKRRRVQGNINSYAE